MKRSKTRATATQFETALIEELKHAQGQNIPANALSSVTSFTLLIARRLYGDRAMGAELSALYNEIRFNAVEERKEADRQERRAVEQQKEIEDKKKRASASRLIIPGRN